MKKLLQQFALFICLLICTTIVNAQPSWQWGKSGGSIADVSSSQVEDVIDMATDTKGNIYVLATVYGIPMVDGHTGFGASDRLVVASWNCGGQLRWIKFFGSGSSCIGRSLGVDTLGGVYISGGIYSINGSIGGPGYFDADTTLDNNYKSMFIIKYDTAGVFQWLKMPQPDTLTAFDQSGVADMGIAKNGDVYLYSRLKPGLYDNGAFNVASERMYVLKYNVNGTYQKLVPLSMTLSGSYSAGYGYSNAVQAQFNRDPINGRYYLCGRCDTAYFGHMTFGNTAINTPIYLGCFDSTGNSLWTKQCIGNALNAGWVSGPALTDTDENVYIGGVIYSNDAWNGYLIDNDSFTTLTTSCPFVAKMDKNGNNIWVSHAESEGGHNFCGIAMANNVIACTGPYVQMAWGGFYANQFNSGPSPMVDNFLVRINAITGKVISLDSLRSSYGLAENANAIASDKSGNFFVGGRMQYDLFIGPDTVVSVGGNFDWFVGKYGYSNCNCAIPSVSFSALQVSTGTNFTYTGSMPVDSVTWDFGDGSKGKGITVSHSYAGAGTYTVCAMAYSNCSYSLSCDDVTILVTDIQDRPYNSGPSVYPNPVDNMVHIDHSDAGDNVTVLNMAGQLLLQRIACESPCSIDVSSLPAGVYLVRITDKQGAQTMSRFVKE